MIGRGAPRRVPELLRSLAETRRRDDPRPAFLDGLLLGAMVGAAIAGSTLWRRWQRRGRVISTDDAAIPGPAGVDAAR